MSIGARADYTLIIGYVQTTSHRLVAVVADAATNQKAHACDRAARSHAARRRTADCGSVCVAQGERVFTLRLYVCAHLRAAVARRRRRRCPGTPL